MADQLTEAAGRLERLLLEAFGARHAAIDDWAVVKFAICEAQRAREEAANPPVFVVNGAPPPLTNEQIDLIAADGMRNAAGGIYATSVHEFARAIEAAARRAGGTAELGTVSEYVIEGEPRLRGMGDIRVCRCKQVGGGVKWAVRGVLGDCLNRDGEWEDEPLPSSRSDDFLARCRFDSAEEALAAARRAPWTPKCRAAGP